MTRLFLALAAAVIAFESTRAAEPRVITRLPMRSLNDLVLASIRAMPSGGSYSTSAAANRLLESAIGVTPSGIALAPARACPSYCSSATYLVFLRTLQHLIRSGGLTLDGETLAALLVRGQRDGEGVWGRWNANGPGTARLFAELNLGSNFTSFAEARPGDFMKIFWTTEIGRRERGHSVIYLGSEMLDGVEQVRFWSSNNPGGYGERTVPRSEIARVVFSRLETPANLFRIKSAPLTDRYLASLLSVRSTAREMHVRCEID